MSGWPSFYFLQGCCSTASHSCLNAQVGVTTSSLKYWSIFPHFGTVLWQPTRCTLLIAAAYSGIGINMGNNQSMSCDSNTEPTSSSHEHFAYITLPAPIMEYLEPVVLELFHHGNGLVRHSIWNILVLWLINDHPTATTSVVEKLPFTSRLQAAAKWFAIPHNGKQVWWYYWSYKAYCESSHEWIAWGIVSWVKI